jgi:hypothetical protein
MRLSKIVEAGPMGSTRDQQQTFVDQRRLGAAFAHGHPTPLTCVCRGLRECADSVSSNDNRDLGLAMSTMRSNCLRRCGQRWSSSSNCCSCIDRWQREVKAAGQPSRTPYVTLIPPDTQLVDTD